MSRRKYKDMFRMMMWLMTSKQRLCYESQQSGRFFRRVLFLEQKTMSDEWLRDCESLR